MAVLEHERSRGAEIIKHDLPRRPVSAPERLISVIPPPNFGAVEAGQLYRSAYPQPHNLKFIKGLRLKTILCLVETDLSDECADYIDTNNIRRLRVDISANKDGKVKSTMESIYEALLIVMDITNYPLLIHCNQGRHRTGCVIACLRKMQGIPFDNIMTEYETYATPKAREGDRKLVQLFNPEAMLDHVKNNVQFEHRPSLMQLLRSDLVDVDALVKILSSTDGVFHAHMSLKSNTSSKADSGVEFGMTTIEEEPEMPTQLDALQLEEQVQVSVEECEPITPPVDCGEKILA